MYRIIPLPRPKPLPSSVASIALGFLVSWLGWGRIYFVIPTLFFLGNWLRLWLRGASYQFGGEALHLISPLYTRKIPYAQIAPRLPEAQPLDHGVLLYYQDQGGQKRAALLSLPKGSGSEAWGSSQIVFYKRLVGLCGVQPKKDPERRALASSPEVSPKELLTLAREFPTETLENPALLLFSLEDPDTYANLIAEATRGQVEEWFLFASEAQQRLFLCDSIERVVALGVSRPGELWPLLEANRQFSLGGLSQRRLERIQRQERKQFMPHGLPLALRFSISLLYSDPTRALQILLDNCTQQDKALYRALLVWQGQRIKEVRP